MLELFASAVGVRMVLRSYIPGPPLSHFVDYLWQCEGYRPPHRMERVVPDGSMRLIINLQDNVLGRQNPGPSHSFGSCLFAGAHSRFVMLDTRSQEATMGVHFKPGGASPFLRMPASELQGANVQLETVWGPRGLDLRDELLNARTPTARFEILERYLIAQSAGHLVKHPAVAFAVKEFGHVPRARTISEVSDQIGISWRRFTQMFSDEVGLTPKLFCRVRRFQEALVMIRKGGRVSWVNVALDCGYFDQSHFIHDFKAFSGLNPSSYVANPDERFSGHIPLLD